MKIEKTFLKEWQKLTGHFSDYLKRLNCQMYSKIIILLKLIFKIVNSGTQLYANKEVPRKVRLLDHIKSEKIPKFPQKSAKISHRIFK